MMHKFNIKKKTAYRITSFKRTVEMNQPWNTTQFQ